ncbi:hypothetical protein ACFWFF_37585 [Streptomyces sp. NPDC060223]|uniref:hypothetical protein n=1 Tax=unclassified Streptomyces TaxID=2593676 RepID=UPI0036420553
MPALTDLRAEVVEVLQAADINAVANVPDRLSPPLAIVTPGVPYVGTINQFGKYQVNIQVLLVTGTGTNLAITEALDTAIETAVVALDEAEYDLQQVGEPTGFDINGATYLGALIAITTSVSLGG